jgi:3-methyladenine DNA glycosylase AlkC
MRRVNRADEAIAQIREYHAKWQNESKKRLCLASSRLSIEWSKSIRMARARSSRRVTGLDKEYDDQPG